MEKSYKTERSSIMLNENCWYIQFKIDGKQSEIIVSNKLKQAFINKRGILKAKAATNI